jgi:mono/diheme cytochrome c family protein
MRRRWIRWLIIGLCSLFLGAQVVPYGRDHTNPAARTEPAWDNPRTRTLAVRACYDCHSNETVWPWYSGIAPASWLIQRDVDKGRRELNFSEWHRRQKEAHESAKTVQKGSMPPWYYPWAQLSSAERQALIQGLEITLGTKAIEREHGVEDRRDGEHSHD